MTSTHSKLVGEEWVVQPPLRVGGTEARPTDAQREMLLETQRAAASEWMNVIGHLPRSYEGELHGVVEDAFAAGEKAALQRVVKAIARANERMPGIETPRMHGDNLAVSLCTFFDDGEDPEGDEGAEGTWSRAAIAGYEETVAAIRAHYSDAITKAGG